MKVVALASQKGGTGKTTLCVHLAVEASHRGMTVAIADLDPQTSSMSFRDRRTKFNVDDEPTVISLQPSRLEAFLDKVRGSADYVFLDAPPTGDLTLSAAEVSDHILIPCRTSILDLDAIVTTARIARLVSKPATVVLNAVPTRAPLIISDATEAVAKYKLPVAPIVIHQRSVFGRAMLHGRVAAEFEPDCKAAVEIKDLFDWLLQSTH